MWTHLQPYLPNDQRAVTIRRKARIGLWRAINLQQLIVLTGSGTTAGLGQPSWNRALIDFVALSLVEFSQTFAGKSSEEDPDENPNPIFERAPDQLIRLFQQITTLCQLKDANTEFYSLAFEMDPDVKLRKQLEDRLAQDVLKADTLRTVVDLCEELLHDMDAALPVPRHHAAVRKKFADLFYCDAPEVLKNGLFRDQRDNPIQAIFKYTNATRVLTTNYDAEIEKHLYDKWLASEPQTEAHQNFEALAVSSKDQSHPDTRSIRVKSALRRDIVSASIDSSNVGDLVNFASFSRSEQYQVFHLHGRLDRPQEMVVTGRDYRRIYAQDPASAEAFEAAQEILFAGNDVLLLGFGGEDDVLLPFRRFVARGRPQDQAPRRTFALLPSDHSKDFETKNAAKAIKWALQYDIYTVHYGEKRFRETLGSLIGVEKYLQKCPEDLKNDYQSIQEAFACIDEFRCRRVKPEKAGTIGAPNTDSRGPRWLVDDTQFKKLKAFVRQNPAEFQKRKNLGRWQAALLKHVQAAITQTYTYAMMYELEELGRLSRDWWDARRHAPFERRARYHVADEDIAGAPGYLSVRHCSIWEPDLLAVSPGEWAQLIKARDVAQKAFFDAKSEGRRVLRLAAPRGTGQATLSNLLHHRNNQAFVFGLEPDRYHQGAIMAHLSFSMEFSSVLKAMSRFLCYWTAKSAAKTGATQGTPRLRQRDELLRLNHAAQLKKARLLLGSQPSAPPLTLEEFERLRMLANKMRLASDLKKTIIDKLVDPAAYTKLELHEEALETAAHELVAVAWEDEQRLLDQDDLLLNAHDPAWTDEPAEREHRLDMLRSAMADYTSVSNGERLFICLSGLDRITDVNGDAFNPAHRAFFRLLAGREERTEDRELFIEADKVLPLDIVLIAGQPDAPITYLSKEHSDHNDGSGKPSKPMIGDVQKYSRRSRTDRHLERWAEIPHMPWDMRVKMLKVEINKKDEKHAGDAEEAYQKNPRQEDRIAYKNGVQVFPTPAQAAARFLRWAKTTRSDHAHRGRTELHESSQIHRLLWENLALSLWVMRLWVFQAREFENTGSSPVPIGFHSFLRDLDAAAARDGFDGVLEYILARYEYVDGMRHTNFKALKKSAPGQAKLADLRHETETYVPELHALILRHLVLFALPIEPWVLIGCPNIHALLKKEFERRQEPLTKLPEVPSKLRSEGDFKYLRQAYLARTEWLQRAFMLKEIRICLETLRQRALVIEVKPAADQVVKGGDPKEKDDAFLHLRYALHNRFRQKLADVIRLGVHDGADINHHRMSIYCDQPRDLPSPSPEHFLLVKDILENQIDQCRQTLAAMFQLGHEYRRVKDIMEGWDTPNGSPAQEPDDALDDNGDTGDELARLAAARRILKPDMSFSFGWDQNTLTKLHRVLNSHLDKLGFDSWEEVDNLAGSLGRLHAVPQRLRGLLSVLQGSFSIGSLSRMTDTTEYTSEGAQTPFDAYRSWLRSLMNAGASLDRTQNEFERLFCGSTFQQDAAGGGKGSKWLENAKPGEAEPAFDRIREGEQRILEVAEKIGFKQSQKSNVNEVRHPFYRDEIAWIYNERGLAALTQGMVSDALPLLRQATFIMSHRKTPEADTHAFHAAERRIQLNYAIALLEHGEVRDAQRLFNELNAGSIQLPTSTPSEIYPFSELFLAVCDHIGGGFGRAKTKYAHLQDAFATNNQFRAVAITCRCHADLARSQQQFVEGLELAELAIKAASRSEQRDVEHLALVTKARLLISKEQSTDAIPILDRALNYSRQMGLVRIEIDAKIAMSTLMTQQGDYSLAGQYASEAVSRSIRSGLRLRKLSALLTYAKSRKERGSSDFSKRLLQKIVWEAENAGYMTLAGLATSEL